MYARQTGKTPFVVYQGPWNILVRDLEREILPMVREEGVYMIGQYRYLELTSSIAGMAIAPFSVLAAGKIRTDAEEQRRRETGEKGENT